MSFKIAVSGKGGTGKTTICAAIINYLKLNGLTPILAVDADPSADLAEALGVDFKQTVGSVLHGFLKEKDGIPFGVAKESVIECKLYEILVENEGFDLLVMGRGEGPGCYCYPNAVLREAIDRLSESYAYVVVDNQAGMEHISRRTNGDLDTLLFISDPSVRSIKNAGNLRDLVKELDIKVKRSYLIVNRVKDDLSEEIIDEISRRNLDLLGVIPEEEWISKGGAIDQGLANDTPFTRSIYRLMERLRKE